MSDRLKKLISQIDASVSDDSIIEMLNSIDSDMRLQGLIAIRKKVESDSIPDFSNFEKLKRLLSDSDNDCKWQAFIVIGSFMETKPAECWQLITEFGDSSDEDTRTAVATVLLEHYFEVNPQLFDSKFKDYKRLVNSGRKNLLWTMSMCKSDWGSENNRIKVDRFLKNQRGGK